MAATVAAVPAPTRKVPCEKCPLRGKPVLRDFTPEELAFIAEFKSGELQVEAGTTLFMQDANSAHLYTILSGWAFRYKTLPDGRRQILNYALPSDLIGLQGSIANEMQHSVEALTDMLLCVFPREKLWTLYSSYPALAFDVTWLAAREEQILDENLLNVGRRSSIERIAYLVLHLFTRAEEVGLAKADSVQFPFTQQQIADITGQTSVNVNRVLADLERQRLIRREGREITFEDWGELRRVASFSPAYLQ